MCPRLLISGLRNLLCLLITLSISAPGFAKDPSASRAEAIEQISSEDVSSQTLRFKIIQSRMLILYMMDILPNKGNPYYHMANFAAEVTLPDFKAAQSTNSPFMNSEAPAFWLPLDEGEVPRESDLKNPQLAPVFQYFAKYVAVTEIMENSIQPVLKSSIIIGSVKQTAGAEVDTKFQKAWQFIKVYSDTYQNLLTANKVTAQLLEIEKKKALLQTVASIARGMQPYISRLASESNQESLEQFIAGLAELASIGSSSKDLLDSKIKVQRLTDPNSQQYKQVSSVLESVDLPDSGDIDGADEAFEVAMRLEVGFDVIQKLTNQIKETW